MESFARISLLYDYYGALLSEKQRNAMELHYWHDLSLSEIATELNISRPGVADLLRRSMDDLNHYEKHLHLLQEAQERQNVLHLLQLATEEQDFLRALGLIGKLFEMERREPNV